VPERIKDPKTRPNREKQPDKQPNKKSPVSRTGRPDAESFPGAERGTPDTRPRPGDERERRRGDQQEEDWSSEE
jgi:hypothetical protein